MSGTQESFQFPQSNIDVPDLLLGPFTYEIGTAFQLLRPGAQEEIVEEGEVQISPRIKERCVKLDNGETIIITKRKKVARPPDVDGVLRLVSPGRYEWDSHRLIDDAINDVEQNGLAASSARAARSWTDKLKYRAEKTPVDSPADYGMRPPQLGALFSIGAYWSLSSAPATIVMPTGTGKTETMLAALAAHQIENLVVAVPSKALRGQIAHKFKSFGILLSIGVLPEDIDYPVVGIVHRRPKDASELALFSDCNVTIGVVSSLAGGTATPLLPQIASSAGALIVDETHHVAAKTWRSLRDAFSKKPILQFTATPFRNDGKLVDGSVIYSYPLKAAQEAQYFKKIDFVPVHELDPDNADQQIAEAAVQRMRDDIAVGRPHQMMARCRSRERAEELIGVYRALAPDLNPILIHSDITDSDERVAQVRSGQAQIVVCVNMLGEGVDIPALKIAAIHDMHQSMAVLLQFVGRFTRVGDPRLGDASVVANIADPHISGALEQLYGEDADWNEILREMSSNAAKEHAEFINFLENSESFDTASEEVSNISQSSLRPTFSTLFYRCTAFRPKAFVEGLPSKYLLVRVWLNQERQTLYFVTRSTERVKWSRTKEVEHVQWHLFVLHHDAALGLLYLASTDKASDHAALAKAVGATPQLSGEEMFRSLGKIGRLVFNNLGVTKHGRKNLSFAMYTGADVKHALSESEKKGSRKSNISGYGWEGGQQVTIGCSYRGRVWSKANGNIPQLIKWSHDVGSKLVDDSIDTKSIIANVLIPEYVQKLPDYEVLSIDWPAELLTQSEDRVSVVYQGNEVELHNLDIVCNEVDRQANAIQFEIIAGEEAGSYSKFKMTIKGEEGYEIQCRDGLSPTLRLGNSETELVHFFERYPPLIRFVDLSELDGNILLKAEDAGTIEVSDERFEVWDWSDTDITKESIWRHGEKREKSIQGRVATHFIDAGFAVVYDDDDTGEAADLICLKEEADYLRLALVHCKFSGEDREGRRVKDVVEVSSQAVRSARWPGKFKELVKHMQIREKRHRGDPDRSGYLSGQPANITTMLRSSRFKEVRPQILIVQPGVSKSKRTRDQSVVLGAAVSYLKQTLGIDLDIICSA